MTTIEIFLEEQIAASKVFDIYTKIPHVAEDLLKYYAAGDRALDGIGKLKEPLTPDQQQHIKFFHQKTSTQNGVAISTTAKSRELYEKQGVKTNEYDMKKTYPYGKKSRISKKGTPYLIIPFRWGTPNEKGTKRAHFASFIPQANYTLNVSKLKVTQRLDTTHPEPNFKGEQIERSEYGYMSGRKMRRGFAEALKDSDAFGDISRFSGLHYSAGMVRMKSNTGTNYFTFRTITPFQPKDMWIRKGKTIPGIDIESAWARSVKKAVLGMMK